MVNSRIEDYNYYHDSRVQAGMFQTCWKIIRQDGKSAVIEFDEDWFESSVYEHEISKAVDQWMADGLDFTIHCSDLKKRLSEKHEARVSFANIIHKTYRFPLEVPDEEKRFLERLRVEEDEIYQNFNVEFGKIEDLAKSQNPIEEVARRLGFESISNYDTDEERPYCMRVTVEFHVCHLCEGSGSVTNPNIDCCGLSFDAGYDYDPDFEDDYFSGRYNITCPTCKGLRVEPSPCFPEWLSELIQRYENDRWDDIRTRCAEAAMGA